MENDNDLDEDGGCGGRKVVGFEIYFQGIINRTKQQNKQGNEIKGGIKSFGFTKYFTCII